MIELKERTAEHVKIYFTKVQDAEIEKGLPISAKTVEDALQLFYETKQPNAKSIGKTIYYNGRYVGDVWCYRLWDEPDAMLSYCIFEKSLWGKGIASKAVALFTSFLQNKLGVKTIGAFTYAENTASVGVLKRNGFAIVEEFTDDGRASIYFEKKM